MYVTRARARLGRGGHAALERVAEALVEWGGWEGAGVSRRGTADSGFWRKGEAEAGRTWKKRNDRKKSTMKMQTSEQTTLLVVLKPTPLAPPRVVTPNAHEMMATSTPNTAALSSIDMMSHGASACAAESRMVFAETS